MTREVKKFANIHRDETCVVIGNGPSLNKTPLDELHKKYITMGSNRIYTLPFTPDYYCIIDELMLKACLPLPEDFRPEAMFLRAEACVKGNYPIYPIVVNGFSPDISNFVVMGGTVTYALLQIAFYMDFSTVLLVGVDHYYPKTSRMEEGLHFVAGGKDPDHFTPKNGKPYFSSGKRYSAPALTGSEKYYAVADSIFKKFGARIVNLTPGTKLDVFEKGKCEDWL